MPTRGYAAKGALGLLSARPRLLFLYAITERGVDRLDYWESEADLE